MLMKGKLTNYSTFNIKNRAVSEVATLSVKGLWMGIQCSHALNLESQNLKPRNP